jgi:predicted dehydrogenase
VEAGKDVYLEKPISLRVADGLCMADAVRRAHRVVQVGSQRRSNPLFHEAAAIRQSGSAGDVRLALESQRTGRRVVWDAAKRQMV